MVDVEQGLHGIYHASDVAPYETPVLSPKIAPGEMFTHQVFGIGGGEKHRRKTPTIDLTGAYGREEQAQTIIDFVKSRPNYRKGVKQGKYQRGLLYRCFNGDNIPKVLQTGQDTDRRSIYCSTEEELFLDGDESA